jgi:diguanylate cyclase (GGDEF)-like protein/PAS domain S-box-containing protein
MKNGKRTQAQLLEELKRLRQRVAELEQMVNGSRSVREALRESQEQFRFLFESAPEFMHVLDTQGIILKTNSMTIKSLGYSEVELVGQPWAKFLTTASRKRFARQLPVLMENGVDHQEMELVCRNGRVITMDCFAMAIRNEQGEITSFVVYERDISDRRQAEEALRESRRKIEGLHEAARGLESCQREEEAYQITVASAEEILDFSMCALDIVEGNKLVVKATSSGLPPGASVETDLDEVNLASKTYRTGETILFSNLDEVPEASPTHEDFQSGISAPIGHIGVFQVVSTEKNAFTTEDVRLLELLLGHTIEAVLRIRLQNQLREQATRDPLTGLYNRRHFRESIERETRRSQRYQHSIGFLMIDVDRFKKINDTHGHQTGDRVLQEVGDFLRKHVRAAEMVVRYGGDEFLIVMPELEEETNIVKQRLMEALARWNETNGTFDFPVGLSIGGANWDPRGSESLEEALARADQQMYEEKRRRLVADQPAERRYPVRNLKG